jgi:hypothetical protein
MYERRLVGAFAALVLTIALVTGCERAPETSPGYLLMFQEKEPGAEFSPTRMIVTADFLRIDDNRNDNEFVLFDRKKHIIYNVTQGDRLVLVIKEKPVGLARPEPFESTVEESELKDSPPVGGKRVMRYVLRTNGQECYEVFAAKGLLEEPRKALAEFHTALAGEQSDSFATTPPEFRSDCDLADNVFEPDRHLAFGFPVRLVQPDGRVRMLVDYDEHYTPDPKLFELPADFTRYTMDDMRAR